MLYLPMNGIQDMRKYFFPFGIFANQYFPLGIYFSQLLIEGDPGQNGKPFFFAISFGWIFPGEVLIENHTERDGKEGDQVCHHG
jgi:hypothetical protein